MVCEPYRALESVQGVRFQGKNCFTKMASKLLLNWFWLFITWKAKQKILLWHFGICLGQCRTDGREYAISLRPITGAGFWKKNLYQKWWRFPTITMQKTFSEGCALCKKIFWWHFGIFTFSVTRRFLINCKKGWWEVQRQPEPLCGTSVLLTDRKRTP